MPRFPGARTEMSMLSGASSIKVRVSSFPARSTMSAIGIFGLPSPNAFGSGGCSLPEMRLTVIHPTEDLASILDSRMPQILAGNWPRFLRVGAEISCSIPTVQNDRQCHGRRPVPS